MPAFDRTLRPRRVIVIGGGISGLATAYRLTRMRPDLEVRILEERARVGGNIRTDQVGGFVMDGGPDGFLASSSGVRSLCSELGISSELIAPPASEISIAHGSRLVPLPSGMTLGVPTELRPFARSNLLSWSGKLRALCEPLAPGAPCPGEDESLHDFFSRRIGREAAERITAPLFGGIYGGRPEMISVKATLPMLPRMEHEHGSLLLGLWGAARRRGTSNRGAFASLRGGMGSLVAALVDRLPPNTIVRGSRVERIAPRDRGQGFLVQADGAEVLADAVIVTAPAHRAADMFASVALGSALREFSYASTITVYAAFPKHACLEPLAGSGCLVPAGEGRVSACTFVSQKWGREQPEDQVLLRAFVGGAREPELVQQDDATIRAVVLEEMRRLLGIAGNPTLTRAFRHHRATPEPTIGHASRVQSLHGLASELPGLAFVGAAYGEVGVGIADCIARANNAATRLARELPSG